MPQYVLVFGAHAMAHIPESDLADVDRAAHEVCQQAIDAGVWVCGGGVHAGRAGVVAADGTVRDGPDVPVGGLTVVEVSSREEAHAWAAKWAAACRCDQEVWELGDDPQIDEMLGRLRAGDPPPDV